MKSLGFPKLLALGSLVLASVSASAQTPALTLSGGTTRNDYGGTVGFSFTVGNQPITVTELGYYNGPGFQGNAGGTPTSHQVAIYNDATHAQIGPVGTVTYDGTTPADGSFIYTPVTPFVLAANTTYDAAASNISGTSNTTGNQDYLTGATGVVDGADITYITSRYAGNSSTVVFPASTYSPNDVGNIGPDFLYTTGAVPEPSTWMAAGGLLLLAAGDFRRRLKA